MLIEMLNAINIYLAISVSIKELNVLCLNCASIFCSRNYLGSVLQSLAAENLNEVCPLSFNYSGRSIKVASLRDRQCLDIKA